MTNILDNLIYKPWQDFITNKGTKLLAVVDWSKITPAQLRQYIADGYVVDWIDGYDKGPSPLTDALMANASLEIIALLIDAGANVNAPTVLSDGTKITPLKIVRSQEPTHENVQKELMLMRAGATDDVWDWLRNDDTYPNNYWKAIKYIGLYHWNDNQYSYRVFEPIPTTPTEITSPVYIVQHMGEITWADAELVEDFDIYDKTKLSDNKHNPEVIIHNELGDKFAKQFLSEASKLSFDVAMDRYYTYLISAMDDCEQRSYKYTYGPYLHKYDRIAMAQKDLRKRTSLPKPNKISTKK